MKIYVAQYEYTTSDGYGHGTMYVGYSLSRAREMLSDEKIYEEFPSAREDHIGNIRKTISIWVDGDIYGMVGMEYDDEFKV